MRTFLGKLRHERKLQVVEPSAAISEAYLQKAKNCLRSAKLLLDASLYENSIAEGYYVMYNALQSCLWRCGIKCENHTAAIFLIENLFGKAELRKKIEQAKKERIDKQYYITGEVNKPLTAQAAREMVGDAEEVLSELRILLQNVDEEVIWQAQKNVKSL